MLLKLFCIGLIFFSGYDRSDRLEVVYSNNILGGELVSESAWALSTLYYDAPAEEKINILHNIPNQALSDALRENSNQTEFVVHINREFNSESLLLFLLLNESDEKNRNFLFNSFYKRAENPLLKELNALVRDGQLITPDAIDADNFKFEHYLIAQYHNVNNVASEDLFRFFTDLWLHEAKEKVQGLSGELKLLTVFSSLYQNNELSTLSPLYDSLINLEQIPRSRLMRNILWRLDLATYRLGEVDKSLHIQREFTIPLSKYLNDQQALLNIYANHGGYLYVLARFNEAKKIFQDALENEEYLSTANQTRLHNNLSLIYFKTGESNKYINSQLKALEFAKSIENYNHQISIYRNLHIFYMKNRNWDLANNYISLAIELAEKQGNIDDQISLFSFKASFVEQAFRDYDRAYELLNIAESLFNEHSEVREMTRALYEKSRILRLNHQYEESKKALDQIFENFSSELNRPSYLELLLQLARIEFIQGNLEEAKELLSEFRAHDISVIDFPVFVLYQTLRGNILQREDNNSEVNRLFDQTASMIFERTRNMADFESGYWSVEPEYLDFFESYTDYLISRKNYREAIILLDQVKTINDAALLENPLVRESRMTEEELVEERQLTDEMDAIRKKLFNATGSKRMDLQRELEQLNSRRSELTRNLEQQNLHDLPSVWSIQRSLRKNQIVIHITEINDSYYIAEIHHNKIDVVKKRLDENTRGRFELAVQSVTSGRSDLEALYDAGVFLNIQSIPDHITSIIVMPDGYLHQLPISIFPVKPVDSAYSYGSATYLIEKASLRTANSLADLTKREKTGHFSYDYSGFGVSDFQNEATNRNLVSLPQAPGEVVSISNQLHRFSANNYFVEDNASTENFREFAVNSRILHLASHSEISESDPLFSRIHLSPSQIGESDELAYQLFAYELFDLNLQNDLIMLNSCESGAGRYLQGSGIMGISRALRYAGAKSLVLNAWSVNDHFAAVFAEEFYKHLNRGESKSRALQLTKLHFITENNANPHFWGPYILNGSDAPLISKPELRAGNWLLFITFLAGLIVVSYRNQQNGI